MWPQSAFDSSQQASISNHNLIHYSPLTDPSARTWSLYTITNLAEDENAQTETVLSCGLLPQILGLMKGMSPQLFEGDHYFVGDTLKYLTRAEDIPALLELL